ncbi:MAG: hypothetical protein KGH72_03985 [Candidatus Micrarchaeota archaeon]|nr:hypothetical protein [Candidatus Micrarchaeota archaeon]
MNFRNMIIFVTILLFIYNAFFTYIIVNLTSGTGRFVFLLLISLDYVIIFYFVLSIATELKRNKLFSKISAKVGRKAR